MIEVIEDKDTFKERFDEAIRKDTSAVFTVLSNENPNRFCELCFAEPQFKPVENKVLLKYFNTQHRAKLTAANQALLDQMLLGRKQDPNAQPVLVAANKLSVLYQTEVPVWSSRARRSPLSDPNELRKTVAGYGWHK